MSCSIIICSLLFVLIILPLIPQIQLFHNNLEVTYKRDERILRFLTVSLDKHAVAYADKRKGIKAEAKTKKKESANA